jgi:hypothetical protein
VCIHDKQELSELLKDKKVEKTWLPLNELGNQKEVNFHGK